MQIRQLPAGVDKLMSAELLANLSTEGDLGADTLREVAETLSEAVKETPEPPDPTGAPGFAYMELASLSNYEHVKVDLNVPAYKDAVARISAVSRARAKVNFTLKDIDGKSWKLSELRGKVVVVNFWATWCPPCHKEMPDLDDLFKEFSNRGLIVLAVTDEKPDVVRKYLAQHPVSYTILLDPGRQVNKDYQIDGIPKSFFYNAKGKLVATAIDMRTKKQFLALLAKAGIATAPATSGSR